MSHMALEEEREAELADLVLSGTAEAEVFAVPDVAGTVTIAGFLPDEGDVLDLSAFGFTDFAAVQAVLEADGPDGADSRLALDADTDLVLVGVLPSLLEEGHVQLPTV